MDDDINYNMIFKRLNKCQYNDVQINKMFISKVKNL